MGKGIILGIDFSIDFTQMAVLDDEINPRSISIGTEDNFLIPSVVCYNSELNEWSAGDEAVNKSRLNNSTEYRKLPEILKQNYGEDLTKQIITTYMSYLLKVAVNYSNGKLIKNVLVTLNEVTPEMIELITTSFTNLGYNANDIKIISHSESFVYYVLNQGKDIWINQVYFLNFDRNDFSCRKLNVIKGKQVHVADVTVEDLNDRMTYDSVKNNMDMADEIVADYMEDQLKEMVKEVQDLCKEVVAARFANAGVGSGSASMYIDPMLFHIPLSIGDRSETVQDTSCALQGTRFPVEGDKVRLFMQWGKGLPAQHLDMDLSCHITLPSTTEVCSFFNLQAIGAKHSGDIRSIPNKKGTAEYIELDLNELNRVGAEYVAFTCNAYSNGTISPNLVVGWMNSAYPMKISERTGVAYDPSCVQHQVRISQSLQKGLVFGVLKVKEREIVWLEIPFGGQTILSLDTQTIEKYLDKLEAKTTVGELLAVKAQAQGLKLVDIPEADEIYTREWALNTAAVTKLLLGD